MERNRTLLDECFRVAGRTPWYETIAEIQADLDRYLSDYNLERRHQGSWLQGRTPSQALREALGLTELPPLIPKEILIMEQPEAVTAAQEPTVAQLPNLNKRRASECRSRLTTTQLLPAHQ